MLVASVLLFSLVLIKLPDMTVEGASGPFVAATLLPFVAAIASLLMWQGRWRAAPPVLLVITYGVLQVIALLRAGHVGVMAANVAASESIQIVLVAALGCLAFLRAADPEKRRRYLHAVCWAPVVFVGVNVSLHLAGYSAPGTEAASGGAAQTLSLFGVVAERVEFPSGGGATGIAPTAAIAFAVCCVMFRERRVIATAGAAVSAYAILLSDSRAALGATLFAVSVLLIAPRYRPRLGWVAATLPLLPVLVIVGLGALDNSHVASRFDRTYGESFSRGTGRTTIWEATWNELSHPKPVHLIGYGHNGQVVSGVSVGYAALFERQRDPLLRSTHNLVLQTALDIGWIGVVCLLALAASVLGRLAWWAKRERVFLALLAGVLALLLAGVFEATPTPGHPDSFAWWLLVAFAAMRVKSGPVAARETSGDLDHPYSQGQSQRASS